MYQAVRNPTTIVVDSEFAELLEPMSSQTIGHLVRMAGLVRPINRSYRVKRKW